MNGYRCRSCGGTVFRHIITRTMQEVFDSENSSLRETEPCEEITELSHWRCDDCMVKVPKKDLEVFLDQVYNANK